MLRRNCFAMGICLSLFLFLGAAIALHSAEPVAPKMAEPAVARQEGAFLLPADKRPTSWTVLKAGDLVLFLTARATVCSCSACSIWQSIDNCWPPRQFRCLP